jgi:hypothetical protein
MHTQIDNGAVKVFCPNSHREHAPAPGGDHENHEGAKGSNHG